MLWLSRNIWFIATKKSVVIFIWYMNHRIQRQERPIRLHSPSSCHCKMALYHIFSSTLCNLVLNISANNRILTTSLGKLLKGLFKTNMGYFSSYLSCVDRQMDECRYILKNKILLTDLFWGRWIENFRSVFHSSVIGTQVPQQLLKFCNYIFMYVLLQ